MLPGLMVLATLVSSGAHPLAGVSAAWAPTNDVAVAYRWNVAEGARPMCRVQVNDSNPASKRISISYRNQGKAKIEMTVRMTGGDPQERRISGCVGVDLVSVVRE